MTQHCEIDDHGRDHDAVTARDIAEFLHHLAEPGRGARSDDHAERAQFLARKADLLTRIADQHTPSDPRHSEQIRQIATNARAAADHAAHLLYPHQQVEPDHRRTTDREADRGGARSQEKNGASSG
jgi:hypothetical protein